VRGVIVPHWTAEQDTVQETPLLLASSLTVAASLAVRLVCTVAAASDSATEICVGGGNV
jgi:hypothetical protein